MEIDDEQLRRDAARERLKILAAVDQACRRHAEVLPLIVAAADREAARAAVGALLGIEEVAAEGVLDLQWRHLTEAHRAVIAAEQAGVEAFLAASG